ncbi:hypothetical protein KBI23_19385 [bacterium]|nr:hypothetical protein [bacterium]
MINLDTINFDSTNVVSSTVQQGSALQENLAVSSLAAIGRLQDLVERFAAASNKKSVISELKPAYEKLIAAVDAEHEQVSLIVQEEMTGLQMVLSKRLIDARKAERSVEKILEEIENTSTASTISNGAEVVNLLAIRKRYVDPSVCSDELMMLEKHLLAYPQLIAALKENRAAVQAAEPVLLQIDDLEQSLNHCSTHRVKVRYAWADALAGAGSPARSQNVILEAMSIQMGLPVEELKRSRKRRNDRERERERKLQGLMG